jgi:hypothetical protein
VSDVAVLAHLEPVLTDASRIPPLPERREDRSCSTLANDLLDAEPGRRHPVREAARWTP